MIRFIDLRHVAEDVGDRRFAFWNTVTDKFIATDFGDQAWSTFDDFAESYAGDQLDRFKGLTPEWAKRSDTEDKPTDSELHAEAVDMRHTQNPKGDT